MFLNALSRLLGAALELGCGLVLVLLFALGVALLHLGWEGLGSLMTLGVAAFVHSAIRHRKSSVKQASRRH